MHDPLADALLAAELLAIDPAGLGGMVLRGGDEARDQVLEALISALPPGVPVRRMPVHIDDERLLGGLDLGATLALGRPIASRGLLDEARGGVVVMPMAERLGDALAARVAGAEDVLLIALDDGREADERPPVALMEHVAFWVDLSEARPVHFTASPAQAGAQQVRPSQLGPGLRRGTDIEAPDAIIEAIAATTIALGIDSARASQYALRAARASARLAGRDSIEQDDLIIAARLVLGPRATRMPAPSEAAADEAPLPPPPEDSGGDRDQGEAQAIDDVVLEATLASLPRDVLAMIAAGGGRSTPGGRARGAGERRKSAQRGRPVGTRAGIPRGGLRLSLIDTLRAAAPWQRLRGGGRGRVAIRRDDLRIRRFETRAEATTIFAVDASGSSALARLAEAKGAVELLLAEAYVKRAQVALIAFRGQAAEVILPPTRSLARARRSLADLPGGGGTPLAAGLDAARDLAEQARARGRTPFIVVLTDGRANVATGGGLVRAEAEADAQAAARAIGQTGIRSAFVDISARPRPEGAQLAAAMGARYLPLPRADARRMHAAVTEAQR